MTSYWMNEGFRRNTMNLDWFYTAYTLPQHTAFYGTWSDLSLHNNGNFYPQRPIDTNDKNVEYYKADLNSAVSPNDPKFDHTDPTKSGWTKIDQNVVPLLDNDKNDSSSSVYYQKDKKNTILARAKNLSPAYQKDFFLPVFVMQICDGKYCQAPADGYTFQANTIDSFALAEGLCEYCGKSGYGTVVVKQKSFPKIYLDTDKNEVIASNSVNLSITPENHIFASEKVNGLWQLELKDNQNIDWASLKAKTRCNNCKLPKECNIEDIIITQPTKENPIAIWNFDKAKECQPARGYGKNLEGNLCHDSYHGNLNLEITFKTIPKTSGTITAIAKVIPTNQVDDQKWSDSENFVAEQKIIVIGG